MRIEWALILFYFYVSFKSRKTSMFCNASQKKYHVSLQLLFRSSYESFLNPCLDIITFREDCKDMKLLIGKGGLSGNVFRIKPPMCVTKADADFTLQVMRKAIQKISA